jgi:hypothetical protein
MNEAQKRVLNYLKDSEVFSFITIANLFDARELTPQEVCDAYCGLNYKQKLEVLAEFAKWGLKNFK